MMKKTKIGHIGLTNEKFEITYNNSIVTLYRIIALMDFRNVKKGQPGGFTEHIENVNDLAWIGYEAKMYGNAKIFGLSELKGNAELRGEVHVSGTSKIYEKAIIDGAFLIDDEVEIYGNVKIIGLGRIVGSVKISESFESIGRLVISGYDELIEIKGNGMIGSGFYISKSFESFNQKRIHSVLKVLNNTIFTEILTKDYVAH